MRIIYPSYRSDRRSKATAEFGSIDGINPTLQFDRDRHVLLGGVGGDRGQRIIAIRPLPSVPTPFQKKGWPPGWNEAVVVQTFAPVESWMVIEVAVVLLTFKFHVASPLLSTPLEPSTTTV